MLKKARLGIARTFFRLPFLRSFYLKRLMSFLESGGTKKRPLTPELQQLRAALDRLPKRQRMGALETALSQGLKGQTVEEALPSRQLRRAAARQQKTLGKPTRRGGRR